MDALQKNLCFSLQRVQLDYAAVLIKIVISKVGNKVLSQLKFCLDC